MKIELLKNMITKNRTKSETKTDVFQLITDRILASLEAGTIPWKKGWSASNQAPRNWEGKIYQGCNWFLLGMASFENPVFVTFKKALDLGGCVRKGEKGLPVIFWKFLASDKINPANGKAKQIPMLKTFTVFNVSQCDGLPALPAVKLHEWDSVEEAERIVAGMPSAPPISEDGRGKAYYYPASDSVHMPTHKSFFTAEDWYSTLFHELGHSTGHESRNARDLSGKFGSESYAREELVAELTAAFLLAHCKIDALEIDNSAAYIANWTKVLTNDPKAFIWAAGKAQHAARYIMDAETQEEEATKPKRPNLAALPFGAGRP